MKEKEIIELLTDALKESYAYNKEMCEALHIPFPQATFDRIELALKAKEKS